MKVYLSLFLIFALTLTPTFGASLNKKKLAAEIVVTKTEVDVTTTVTATVTATVTSTATSASSDVSVLASISWGTSSSSRRVYSVENGKVIEHANDGGSWYIGSFPQPAAISVAAVYINSGIRVYTTAANGAITEWGYDLTSASNGKWVTGSNIGSGTVLSAAADESYSQGPYCVFYVYAKYNGAIVEHAWASGWGADTLPSSSNI